MIRKAQEAEQREAEAKAAAEAAAAAAAAKGDDDEPEDEFAPPPHADRLGRARLIAQHAELILEATREGILEHELAAEGEDGCLQRLSELLRKDAQEKKRPFNPDEAKEVDEALEAFLPTRFGRYADSDPTMERRAKVLYMDLWREANDRLKPLLVARCGGEISASAAAEAEAKVQEPLERAATYVGVEPELWNKEVSLTLAELEAMIGPRVKRSITKARELYTTARDEEQQGPVGGGGGLLGRESGGGGLLGREGSNGGNGGLVPTKVQVLLAGNSSILPIVRRSFDEVFAGIDHERGTSGTARRPWRRARSRSASSRASSATRAAGSTSGPSTSSSGCRSRWASTAGSSASFRCSSGGPRRARCWCSTRASMSWSAAAWRT